MIRKIRFTDGYAIGLPNIGEREFHFKQGLNILFGPNGCGKSTILKTLKAYSAIPKGGWSTILNPMELGTCFEDDFPSAFARLAPGQCKAHVTWDGTPTFYNEGNIQISDTWFFTNQGVMDDGLTTEAEQMEMLAMSPSSGEFRMSRINKMLEMMQRPPNLDTMPEAFSGDVAIDAQAQINYIQSLSRRGPCSILLDEPERALSITKQGGLFEVLEDFGDEYQLIVATHSTEALGMGDNVNLIDMQENYADECRTAITHLANKF